MERRLDGGLGPQDAGWKIPDEVDVLGETDAEKAFFVKGEVAEATLEEREAAKKEVRKLFLASCAPRIARMGALLLASTAAFGMGKLGFDRQKEKAEIATVIRQAEAEELKRQESMESDSVVRIDALFADAGERMRDPKEYSDMLTPEQAEIFAGAIEGFPLQEVLTVLSDRTEDSPASIAATSRLNFINVYSDESIDSLIAMGGDAMSDVERDALEQQKHASGMHKRGLIELNVTEILKLSEGDPEQMGDLIDDVLFHEFMHTFPQGDLKSGDSGDDLRGRFYEGMTEWISNDIRRAVRGVSDDPFHGYQDGGTSAAAFYVASVHDLTLVYGAYTGGQFDRLSKAYEDKMGVGLDVALQVDGPLADDGRYQSISMLRGLVEAAGDAAPAIAQEANTTLDTGYIYVYQGDQYAGVFVTGDAAPTGINNGLMWDGNDTIVSFSSYFPEGQKGNKLSTYDDYYVAFADITPEGASIDDATVEDRATVVATLAQEVSQLLKQDKS